MHVKILGPLTRDAEILMQNTAIALKKLKIKASFEKVNDFRKVASYGIVAMPALVIDEQLLSYGTILNVEEVMELVKTIL